MKPLVNSILAILALAVCGGAGFGVYSYSLSLAQIEDKPKKLEALAVEVTRLEPRTMEDRVELVGSLAAASDVTIRSRTTGYIKRLPYQVGDYIDAGEAGATVVELDRAQALEGVRRANAALSVAEAELKASQARADETKSRYERLLKLKESQTATLQQVEQAQTAMEVADAEVELQQATKTRALSDVESAQITLDETRIKTSVSGYVAERFVEVDDLADPATPLLRIVNLDKVRTVVHVVERDYDKVHQGQSAEVRVDAYPDKTFEGTVLRIAPVVDLETRTAAVEIEIDNPGHELKPGMYARVALVFARKKRAPVLPVAALLERGERPYVFIVDDAGESAIRREVRTGLFDGRFVEILSGLTPDDPVIALGSRLLSDGDPVTVVGDGGSPSVSTGEGTIAEHAEHDGSDAASGD